MQGACIELFTYKSRAIFSSTHTLLFVVTNSFKLIIECELSSRFNIFDGKKSNSSVSIHCPFLGYAIGVTAVVHESCQITLNNEFVRLSLILIVMIIKNTQNVQQF